MVASISSTPNPRFISSQPPKRPPLLPSDPTATTTSAVPRRPKSREVTSRYLSIPSTSSSSSSSSSSNRSPSPIVSRTAPNTPIPTTNQPNKRSQSVDRRRPGTPAAATEMTAAAKFLVSGGSKRSLSVSFQGETFAVPMMKGASVRRDQRENLKPMEQQRWPGRSNYNNNNNCNNNIDGKLNSVSKSLNCGNSTPEKKKSGGSGAARALLYQSMSDDCSLSSVAGSTTASDLATSDSESVTSRRPRAIAVPARFWQETTNRLRRMPEQNMMKKSFSTDSVSSPPGMPRGSSSPLRGSVRPASPGKVPSGLSPSRGKLSPSRVRSGVNDSVSNTPSVLSFAADARRGKGGENKIADMHELRMLHNRNLQWRFANARANTAMKAQKDTAERNLYTALASTTVLRNSVESKRLELQTLRQQLKLYSILKGQTPYLDDWELLSDDFSSSLTGAVEALVANTLRLPIVDGARADTQEVKDIISSAVDMMYGIGSSVCGLLEKVDEANSLACELANISSSERASLDQCRDLLSTVTAMQVEDCSLRTHTLQVMRMHSSQSRSPNVCVP